MADLYTLSIYGVSVYDDFMVLTKEFDAFKCYSYYILVFYHFEYFIICNYFNDFLVM